MIIYKVITLLVWTFIQYLVLIDSLSQYINILQQANSYRIYNYKYNNHFQYNNNNINYNKHILFMNTKNGLWSSKILPSSYGAVESTMLDSLRLSIINYSNNNNNYNDNYNQLNIYKYLSIDLLTPGLNSKLEQKAMLFQENLFDILISMINILLLSFNNIHFAFQSIGKSTLTTLYIQ